MVHFYLFLLYFFFTIVAIVIARGIFSSWISLKKLKERIRGIVVQAAIISAALIIPFLNVSNSGVSTNVRIQLVVVCIVCGFLLQFNKSKEKIAEYNELDRQNDLPSL